MAKRIERLRGEVIAFFMLPEARVAGVLLGDVAMMEETNSQCEQCWCVRNRVFLFVLDRRTEALSGGHALLILLHALPPFIPLPGLPLSPPPDPDFDV